MWTTTSISTNPMAPKGAIAAKTPAPVDHAADDGRCCGRQGGQGAVDPLRTPPRTHGSERRQRRHGADMGCREGQAVHGLQHEHDLHPRLQGHDGEADGRCGRSDQDQADTRTPAHMASEIDEDQDLGDDPGRPEIADDRIGKPDGTPVDAGEGVECPMAPLNHCSRDQHQPQDSGQFGRDLRVPSLILI